MKFKLTKKGTYSVMSNKAKKDYDRGISVLSREDYLTCLFVAQLHGNRYGDLTKLSVSNGLRFDVTYTTTIGAANLLLGKCQAVGREGRNNNNNITATREDGLAFVHLWERGSGLKRGFLHMQQVGPSRTQLFQHHAWGEGQDL